MLGYPDSASTPKSTSPGFSRLRSKRCPLSSRLQSLANDSLIQQYHYCAARPIPEQRGQGRNASDHFMLSRSLTDLIHRPVRVWKYAVSRNVIPTAVLPFSNSGSTIENVVQPGPDVGLCISRASSVYWTADDLIEKTGLPTFVLHF
jgi:hypothetical protein